MRRIFLAVLLAFAATPLLGAEAPVSFREAVAPILVRNCLGCHNHEKTQGGLNMATFALIRKGGETLGEMILEPGDPDASALVELIRLDGDPRMPFKQDPLSEV